MSPAFCSFAVGLLLACCWLDGLCLAGSWLAAGLQLAAGLSAACRLTFVLDSSLLSMTHVLTDQHTPVQDKVDPSRKRCGREGSGPHATPPG